MAEELASRGAPRSRRVRRDAEDEAFRTRVEERLRSLEQQLAELKARINTLFFLLMGALLTQVVLRLVAG